MNTTKLLNWYGKAQGLLGERPDIRTDARWLILGGLIVYLISLIFRLSFASWWDHPSLMVDGEYIQATHDSYFWLSKAAGFGSTQGYPLSQLASAVHSLTGMKLGNVGFWLPAFLGSLVAPVVFFWGWMLGGRNGGVLGGLTASVVPGFYNRTRLGYYDSDLFTLLGPLIIAAIAGYLLAGYLKRDNEKNFAASPLWQPLALGMVFRLMSYWHADIINISLATQVGFVLIALFFLRGSRRVDAVIVMLTAMLVSIPFYPASTYRLVGLVPVFNMLQTVFGHYADVVMCLGAGGVFWFAANPMRQLMIRKGWILIVLPVLVVAELNLLSGATDAVVKVLDYSSVAVESGSTASAVVPPQYPSIIQSIIEASTDKPFAAMIERMAPNVLFGIIGVIALCLVALVRFEAVFLLPLLLIGLLGFRLGIRFTMFGGAPVLIGLSLASALLGSYLTRRMRQGMWMNAGLQVVLGVMIVGFFFYPNLHKRPTPAVTKAHATALLKLKEFAPADSTVWTWWDWGYATQYYAGLKTPSDGGHHSGQDVYATAIALATASPRQANQIMRYSAQFPPKHTFLRQANKPFVEWNRMGNQETQQLIESMETEDISLSGVPKQYLVVPFTNYRLVKWISHFGNWNVETGKTYSYDSRKFKPGGLGYNVKQGGGMTKQGARFLLHSISLLESEGARSRYYPRNIGRREVVPRTPNLVFDTLSRQSFLLSDEAHASMMIRLLIEDPDHPDIAPYFRLVGEVIPYARIFEVIQN